MRAAEGHYLTVCEQKQKQSAKVSRRPNFKAEDLGLLADSACGTSYYL